MMIRSLIAGLLLLALPMAADAEELGPAIGTELPFTLALADQSGEVRSFDDLAGENGLVLVYSRSLDWCPFCKTQAAELAENADRFAEAGYGLAVVTYDDVEILSTFADSHGDDIAYLSDPDSATIDALGIRNTEMKAGSRFDGVPHPLVLVITPNQVIAGKLWEEDYKDRPKPEVILAELDRLRADKP